MEELISCLRQLCKQNRAENHHDAHAHLNLLGRIMCAILKTMELHVHQTT